MYDFSLFLRNCLYNANRGICSIEIPIFLLNFSKLLPTPNINDLSNLFHLSKRKEKDKTLQNLNAVI